MGQWDLDCGAWKGDEYENKHDGLRKLPPVDPIAPLRSFSNVDEFAQRHWAGTNTEFQYDSLAIRKFNRACHEFNAWPIMRLRAGGARAIDLLVFVGPGDHDALLPKEEEMCGIEIKGIGTQSRLLLATRRENPCSLWKVRHDFWEACMVFEVTLPFKDIKGFEPCFSGPQIAQKLSRGQLISMPDPLPSKCKKVVFQLRISVSTRDAELVALQTLAKRPPTETQSRAFQYTLKFGAPRRFVCLFDSFPHMRNPIIRPQDVPQKLVERFQNLNSMQMEAYKGLLSKIPDGVCILPGGPGAGKTHFNLTVAASLLLENKRVLPNEACPKPFRNKVLFLLDINKPSIDTANKMHQLCQDLGLEKLVIRMFCWSYERTSIQRGRLEAKRAKILQGISHDNSDRDKQPGEVDSSLSHYDPATDKSENIDIHRFSGAFRKAGQSVLKAGLEARVAPTLDQAARRWYEEKKATEYADLKHILEDSACNVLDWGAGSRHEADPAKGIKATTGATAPQPGAAAHDDATKKTGDAKPDKAASDYVLEHEIERVYRAVLQEADVIVATPVTASKFAKHLKSHFQPSLVIFDEAPHARELSTLIAIANFNPVAWMFTGDHRQTKPWVGSYGKDPAVNIYVEQLRMSMMQRAYMANRQMHSLLINHRAHGNLQALGSKLFYHGKMVPAQDPDEQGAIPPSTLHLRERYIMPLKHNKGQEVSRLLVVLRNAGPPKNVQESWYHPQHQLWTMDLVTKLLDDPQFFQTNGKDPGTILIMSPYRRSVLEYCKAVKELKSKNPKFDKRIVEPRTVGTAQGHEADFVILDLTRDWITDHLEDRNRLCVSLTRARQAEIIIMHKDMMEKLTSMRKFSGGPLAKMVSRCVKAGEYVNGPADLRSAIEAPAAQSAPACSQEPAAQTSEAR